MLEPRWTAGFQNQSSEYGNYQLEVEGAVPAWLNGKLLRNGPAKFNLGNETVQHWFDGLSFLHSFNFLNGQIAYCGKFLKSNAYIKSLATGKITSHEFASNPEESALERLTNIFTQPETDNGNVNIMLLNGRYLALTETPFAIEFDPETLDTKGSFVFSDKLHGQITTAHPQYDVENGCIYNLLTHVSKTCKYQIWRTASNSTSRSLVCSIPVKRPGYIHSFAITQKFVVLLETPLLLEPLELLLSGKPYIKNYHWLPEKPARIFIIDKEKGSLEATIETDPCFTFHHVNAYEVPGRIILDLVAYNDPSIIDAFYLNRTKESKPNIPVSYLRRYKISLSDKSADYEQISSNSLELPGINYRIHNGKPYRYLYAGAPLEEGNFLDSLIKIDLQNGQRLSWQEESLFVGEPVFVPAPNASKEDQGLILSLCLSAIQKKSMLVILDALSMTELARAFLPELTPFGLHGLFIHNQGVHHD